MTEVMMWLEIDVCAWLSLLLYICFRSNIDRMQVLGYGTNIITVEVELIRKIKQSVRFPPKVTYHRNYRPIKLT